MVGTPEEQKAGMKWFVSGLVVALLLVAFLMNADALLSNSDREARLGRELKRLRTAQTTISSGVVDPRAIPPSGSAAHPNIVETEADAPSEHH